MDGRFLKIDVSKMTMSIDEFLEEYKKPMPIVMLDDTEECMIDLASPMIEPLPKPNANEKFMKAQLQMIEDQRRLLEDPQFEMARAHLEARKLYEQTKSE